MSVFKWLIAGTVGAAIGGAIWVLLGYFADVEVGYVAWGIGLLAGLGVRQSMPAGEINAAAGFAAVASAFLVIAASKYYVAKLHVDKLLGPLIVADENVEPIDYLASDVVAERAQAGQPVDWPDDDPAAEGADDAEMADLSYPADVLEEARKRWDAMPEADQAQYLEQKQTEMNQQMQAFREMIGNEAFKASFGPHDLLWFGLAIFTAFKVGRGMGTTEDETPPTDSEPPPSETDPPTTTA